MYTALATLKFQAKPRFGIYGRFEWFQDPQGFMTGTFRDWTGKLTGYKLWGLTAGVEYKPTNSSYVRLEGRDLTMDYNQLIFYRNGYFNNYRMEVMLNMGVTFK